MAYSIMVVDDDPAILMMVGLVLEDAGYNTHLVSNPMDAVAIAYAERPDLVVLDLMMPALNGGMVYNLLRERTLTSDIPVIVSSASIDIDARAAAMGVPYVLPKPFTPAELIAIIQRALNP